VAAGTVTVLIMDTGADAVALVRTMTVVAALPNMVLGILVPETDSQDVPLLRLYSIADETPVIASVVALYTAFGADLRAGTVTARTADANAVPVALKRT
jgi:hypothetical protein